MGSFFWYIRKISRVHWEFSVNVPAILSYLLIKVEKYGYLFVFITKVSRSHTVIFFKDFIKISNIVITYHMGYVLDRERGLSQIVHCFR